MCHRELSVFYLTYFTFLRDCLLNLSKLVTSSPCGLNKKIKPTRPVNSDVECPFGKQVSNRVETKGLRAQ